MKILCVQHKFLFAWLSIQQRTRLIITFRKVRVSEGAICFICLNTTFCEFLNQIKISLILHKFNMIICITYCTFIDIFLLMSLPSMYTKASILFHSVPQDEVGLALLFSLCLSFEWRVSMHELKRTQSRLAVHCYC